MRRVVRFGQLATAVVAIVSLIGGAAIACPRGSFCPDLPAGGKATKATKATKPVGPRGASTPAHACCAAEGKTGSTPERGQGRGRGQNDERCPGSCCQLSSELPSAPDGIAAPTFSATAAALPMARAALCRLARPVPSRAIGSSPSLRDPVPPYLLGAAFLI